MCDGNDCAKRMRSMKTTDARIEKKTAATTTIQVYDEYTVPERMKIRKDNKNIKEEEEQKFKSYKNWFCSVRVHENFQVTLHKTRKGFLIQKKKHKKKLEKV